MPIPIKRNTGYALAYGSFAVSGMLIARYLRTAWASPLLYALLGLALAGSILAALVLAADGVRLLVRAPRAAHRPLWGKVLLDFLPLAALIAFWTI